MTYTLQLISLTCLAVQEVGGDEIYLKLNDDIIFTWQQLGKTFNNVPVFPEQTDSFNFQTCQYRTKTGQQGTPHYKGTHFTFRNLSTVVQIELWESDEGEYLRGDDDCFGVLEVDASHEDKHGKRIVFNYKGAIYALQYRVITP
ncbi:MAG: hypothetical protein ACPG7F_04660 [Aggregatilineales bacterium]